MSTIIQPGMSQVDHQAHPGYLATPIQLAVKTDAGPVLHTWGGFSRREVAALQIAAQMLAIEAEKLDTKYFDPGRVYWIGANSWEIAGQLLKQYETLAAEPQSQPDQA